jgi:hypothetical protein
MSIHIAPETSLFSFTAPQNDTCCNFFTVQTAHIRKHVHSLFKNDDFLSGGWKTSQLPRNLSVTAEFPRASPRIKRTSAHSSFV